MLSVRSVSRIEDADAVVQLHGEGAPIPEKLRAAAGAAGFTGGGGTSFEVFTPEGRVVLVGLGASEDHEGAGSHTAELLGRLRRIALDGRGLPPDRVAEFAAACCLRAWRPPVLRKHADPDDPVLDALDILLDDDPGFAALWGPREAAVRATLWARDLVSLPSNLLTPAGFVKKLKDVVKLGATLEVLDAEALRDQGFGALLAVGQGSVNPPCLAVLRWAGTQPDAPVAFVGKGITFDTGGICIKPADRMWEMRADMAGAAAAAGAIMALALRRSPAPAVAVLPLAENVTGAASYRPGDVLRTRSGRTVEVIDTDAEGRLVLADAIDHAVRVLKPRAVIDLATLTGAIVTALGNHMAGLFQNDPGLAAAAVAAGRAAGEPVWPMPIADEHRHELDSDIADLKNCLAGRYQPDACHAAAFLREFAGDTPWVHLDIAGVESREEAEGMTPKGATGFGVRLLDRLVRARFEAAPRA